MEPEAIAASHSPLSGGTFRMTRFNPLRMRRGCSGAAEVEVDDGDNVCRLWMSRKDVERNIIEFGRHRGLVEALESYKAGREVRLPDGH